MERKDLAGIKFKSTKGKEFVILSGYKNSEIIYEECNSNTPLLFCCDAKIIDGKLNGSYCVSYTVPKEEFFAVIENLTEEKKKDADAIACALREKYYKIPTVFLKLVVQAYIQERG